MLLLDNNPTEPLFGVSVFEKYTHLHCPIVPGGITPKLQICMLTKRGGEAGQEPRATGECVLTISMDY